LVIVTRGLNFAGIISKVLYHENDIVIIDSFALITFFVLFLSFSLRGVLRDILSIVDCGKATTRVHASKSLGFGRG